MTHQHLCQKGVSLPKRRRRVELFIRSSAPATRDCQISAVERLRKLNDSERIENIEVRQWETRIPINDKPTETQEVYAAFSEWAREYGVNLHPAFNTRECHSLVTNKTHTALELPVLCLAVSEGDRLHAVFPYTSEERTHTVGDGFDLLEADDPNPTTSHATDTQ